MKSKLPDKASDLLELALNDLEACEQDKENYQVTMSQWHTGEDICRVCLAGSVIAKSLNIPKWLKTNPDKFDRGIRRKLKALDALRLGDIESALYLLKGSFPEYMVETFYMPLYCESALLFKSNLRNIIEYLRENNE